MKQPTSERAAREDFDAPDEDELAVERELRARAAALDFDAEQFEAELDASDLLYAADDIEIDRELAERGLREFVEMAWHEIEPARPFIPGWHIDAISEHLQAITEGELTRLVINVPPGSMKSILACVAWPAWAWTKRPDTKWIYGSYSGQLSRRDALRHRRMIESKWYAQRWGHICKGRRSEEWSATQFSNTAAGWRLSTSVGGMSTGMHADVQVADDPLKPMEVTGSRAISKKALEKADVWWNETMASRLVDFQKSARVIIMQRLHEGDLSGLVLANGGYEHLMLPMEYDSKRKCVVQLTGWQDPRTTDGELLWPEKTNEKGVAKLKRELGPRGAEAQLQQDPSPAGGTIFKRASIKRFDALPDLSRAILVQTWDCAFKETDTSDFVAGFVLAQIGTDIYVVARKHARLAFSETCQAIRDMHVLYPRAVPILIEDKANGPAIISVLKKEIAGVKEVNPLGGKEARANAVEPLFDSGNVWIPNTPWGHEVVEELVKFPAGAHDDQVDALTQGIAYLQAKSYAAFKKAMENIHK